MLFAQVQTAPSKQPGVAVDGLSRGWLWLKEFGWSGVLEWWDAKFTSSNVGMDLSVVVVSLLVAVVVTWILRKVCAGRTWSWLLEVKSKLKPPHEALVFPLVLSVVLGLAVVLTNSMQQSSPITRTLTLLVSIYAVTKIPTFLVRQSYWVRPVMVLAFLAAGLHVLGLFGSTVSLLQSWTIHLGSMRITVFSLVMGPLVLLVLLMLARLVTGITDRRLKANQDLPPVVMVMVGKVVQLGAITAAVVITLQVVGIDLTTLTVFGGALGLGLGFGLQKVVSNLVSGVVLLMDKSVKPGDVVEIGGTYGWVNSMRMRYVSVITRDNKEYLVPNEDLITQPVINWSFTNRLVRLKAPIGISYDSDVHRAIEICKTAAVDNPRVSKNPAPKCLLIGFGDSAIDLQLRFWIEDPNNGVRNITSEILLEIWDRFKEEGITIPYPQRDIHIRSGGKM